MRLIAFAQKMSRDEDSFLFSKPSLRNDRKREMGREAQKPAREASNPNVLARRTLPGHCHSSRVEPERRPHLVHSKVAAWQDDVYYTLHITYYILYILYVILSCPPFTVSRSTDMVLRGERATDHLRIP